MSYTTGTVATTGELLAALASFLTTDGWTINRNTTGANRTGSILQVTSGLCAFAIANETYTFTHYPNYVIDSTTPRDRLKMAIATSISAAVTTYWGHTGSLVTSDADADRVCCNLMSGPYTYWFMSKGNVAERYCHVIISSAGDVFQHFSFGHIEKREFSHSGAAYCNSQEQRLYPTSTTAAGSTHDQARYQNVPFAGNAWGGVTPQSYRLLYVPNALPSGWAQHRVGVNANLQYSYYQDNTDPANSGLQLQPFLNNRASYDGPLAFSGITPMFPIPVISTESGTFACWIGEYPDVRQLNMTGMTPGQEIVFGSDTWKVFPAVKQTQWVQPLTVLPSSAQFAVAYRKIV